MSNTTTPVWEWAIEGVDPLEHMMRRLEAMIDEGGWDAKPKFYALSQLDKSEVPWDERPKVPEELAGAVNYEWQSRLNAALAVGELPLPEFCYENPAEGLPLLLEYLGDLYEGKVVDAQADDGRKVGREDVIRLLDRIVPKGFYGFGLTYEAWTLPDSVPQEERLRVSEDHTTHLRADRVELRVLSFCTREGDIATVMRHRGDIPKFERTDEATKVTGRVPGAMRRMTALFTGFDAIRQGKVPPRGTWGEPSSN